MERREYEGTHPPTDGMYDDEPSTESPFGLDWADISQIREKLQLTPTERLLAAQSFMNTIFWIRTQNGG